MRFSHFYPFFLVFCRFDGAPVLSAPRRFGRPTARETAEECPRSPAAKALPRRRAWLTLRACRPAATVATNDRGSGYQSAVCGGGHEMTAGVHCAHFEILKLGGAMVGVAGPGFDPAAGGAAKDSAEGWLMSAYSGHLWHGGDGGRGWAGRPKQGKIKAGDVVVRRPPCAALRRGCAEGLACACRAWCSTSTPAGERHRPRQLRRIPLLPISC